MGFLSQLLPPLQQVAARLESPAGSNVVSGVGEQEDLSPGVGANVSALLEVLVVLLAALQGGASAAAAHQILLQQGLPHSLALLAAGMPEAHHSALRCLAALLRGSGSCPGLRQQLLSLHLPRLPLGSGGGLMAAVATALGLMVTMPQGKQPASLQAAATYLQLLAVWLAGCRPAVTSFLRAVRHSPFLVDAIRGSNACSGALASSHPVTRGMSCLLLGLCALNAEAGSDTPSREQLAAAMAQQVGVQRAVSVLDAMLAHPAVKLAAAGVAGRAAAAAASARPGGMAGVQGLSLIPGFAEWLAVAAAEVRQLLLPDTASPPQPLQQQQQLLPSPTLQHPATLPAAMPSPSKAPQVLARFVPPGPPAGAATAVAAACSSMVPPSASLGDVTSRWVHSWAGSARQKLRWRSLAASLPDMPDQALGVHLPTAALVHHLGLWHPQCTPPPTPTATAAAPRSMGRASAPTLLSWSLCKGSCRRLGSG